MDEHTSHELAYKKGYEKGRQDAVKRARWVSSGCGFDVCSECRKVYSSGYLTATGIKPRMQFNFCPNCGADMREPPKGE